MQYLSQLRKCRKRRLVKTAPNAKSRFNIINIVCALFHLIRLMKPFAKKRMVFFLLLFAMHKLHLSAYLYTPSGNPCGFSLYVLHHFLFAFLRLDKIKKHRRKFSSMFFMHCETYILYIVKYSLVFSIISSKSAFASLRFKVATCPSLQNAWKARSRFFVTAASTTIS